MTGPQTKFSEALHAEKYRAIGETFREAMGRVAGALTDGPDHFHAFRDALLDMRFLPGGRIQSAMGSTKNVTPYNCFVSGTIQDSFVEGEGSIMQRAAEAATTMRMGGGIGYDFSTLRPRGAMIKKLQSRSGGPIGFMEIFDAVCRCVASSGHRRGAQMGVMRIDHPDIEEFIHAKQNAHRLTGFNISIGVTDEFMRCLTIGKPFALRFNGEVHREVDSSQLWENIMRSTWDWAEPGVLFVDTINRMNNLWYCETIAATNPCGEQPLPPFGACLLGSFNMTRYLSKQPLGWSLDFDRFAADIPVVVRAMDNVVDAATYPLPEQEREAKNKRRMGLGVTGLANALEALGHPYGSPEFLRLTRTILQTLSNQSYLASSALAEEKGSFPLFDPERYGQQGFVATLPEEIRYRIKHYGIRNSHLTSIAPTGTISLCSDNCSSGIEPVFAYKSERILISFDGPETVQVEDYGSRVFQVQGKRTADVTVREHLDVLIAAANNVDSAVSKTCNVPADTPWADFTGLYVEAWEAGAKGCTTFQVGGKRGGILSSKDEPAAESACQIDLETGRKECE